MPFLNFAWKRRRRWIPRNIDQTQLSELAAKMAVVGPPTDPVAQGLFAVVVPLCLASRRLKYRSFKQNISVLPTKRQKLLRLAHLGEAAVERWGGLETVNFSSVENFVGAALLCPNRAAANVHINRCVSDPTFDKKEPWAILTPGAVLNTSNAYRGAFCEYQDGEEYRERIRRHIRTVV